MEYSSFQVFASGVVFFKVCDAGNRGCVLLASKSDPTGSGRRAVGEIELGRLKSCTQTCRSTVNYHQAHMSTTTKIVLVTGCSEGGIGFHL